MNIRNRVRELRFVSAATLQPHPRNWRLHPPTQQTALRNVLQQVGFAQALLARELEDGSLQLIDGHMRAEVSQQGEVPVLILDVSEQEALQLLAALDPLSGLAETDVVVWNSLADELTHCVPNWEPVSPSPAVKKHEAPSSVKNNASAIDKQAEPAIDEAPVYQVIVECATELEQRDVYEQQREQGRRCRLLVM